MTTMDSFTKWQTYNLEESHLNLSKKKNRQSDYILHLLDAISWMHILKDPFVFKRKWSVIQSKTVATELCSLV